MALTHAGITPMPNPALLTPPKLGQRLSQAVLSPSWRSGLALPWVKMRHKEPEQALARGSWVAARGLAPSPAAGGLSLNVCFKETPLQTACTELSAHGVPPPCRTWGALLQLQAPAW